MRYIQTYSTSKMAFKAKGVYAFDKKDLIFLGFDPDGFENLVASHKGITKNRKKLLTSLEGARRRVNSVLNVYSQKQALSRYPWRFEFRAHSDLLSHS